MKTGSDEIAKIIHAAINPDNLTEPPMSIHSVYVDNTLIITIKEVKSIVTMTATLTDLLITFQATENVLELHNRF